MTTNLRTNNRFQDLDGLAIGGINFPADFRDVNRKYLYFSSNEGMVWKTSGVDLFNNLDGSLSYIIENSELGTGVNTLRPQTNQYLMISGSNYNGSLITGGSDRKGTGLSGDIKGQLLIGLTKDDVSSSSSNDNYGSSMTSHISLSHKEIRIIDDKERENNKYYPSYDGGLILNTEGIYKRQSNHWTKLSDTTEVLKSKVIKAPYIHGDIKYSDMKTNIYQGFNAGTTSNILDRVNKEEGKTSQPSILMYKDDVTSNSSNNNYYDYNMVFLDSILNKNEEYKNWKFSINTNSNNILFEGTIDQNQSATLTEDFDNYIINLNNNITPNIIPTSTRSYHLSSVEGSYKGFFLKVSIPAGDETVDYYFKIKNYDSTNKAVYISKEGIKKDDINDIITTVQTSSSSNDRTKLRVLPSEKLTKTISDSIILDGKIKGELYSVSSPSSWPTNIYQKEDYNYLISFGFMKFLSSDVYTAPDSSVIDWGNNSNFYHGWNIELLNPYQKGIIQYHGSINQASSESSPQDIPSRRYYSDSIISVNSGKDEIYGILTSDGLTSEHSTKDNTNPLIQNYYTGWTIELKNENVSPYYIKTIVYTSTSTNGVGTTLTLKDTTSLLTGGSKYILTPPSITGCLLHVNNDSNGDPIFKLEPPYSTIFNFYQGWTIKCGNKISVIDTDSTIGSLNSGTAMGFKNTSGLYKWNSSNDNEEQFKNILHNDNQIPFGTFSSSTGTLINTNHYRNTDPDYYNGWTLKTVNPYTETTIGTYDVSSGSSFSLLSPPLPTGTENSEFFIMPPEYTGWIQFNSGSNNCIIEIPDNLVYSHKPELSNITIDFFKGWNIELTHYYRNTREIDPPTTHETITHGSNTAITKDTESWTIDQYKGKIIFIDTNGSRESRVIVSNTNNTITFDKPLVTAPVTGTSNDTTFIIYSEINEEYNVNIKHQRSYIQNSSISSSNKIELTCPELNIDITDEEIISFVLTPKTKYELYPPLRKNSGFMELESKTHLDLKKPSSKYILTPHNKGVFSKGNFVNNNISAPRLSNNASMVDNFYKGWTIKTKNPDDFGVITSYTGSTREINIESNRNESQKITNNTSYELFPHTEGLFRAQGKLSFYASPFKDYYKNWKIVTRTPQNSGSTKINRRVASIIGYDGDINGSFSGQITTFPNINQFTSTLTTYVLYPPKVVEIPDISVNTDVDYTLEPPNFNSYDNHVEKGEIFSFNDSDDSIIHKKILDKNSKYLLNSFYNNWNISCGNISGKIINYDNNTRAIVSSIEEYEEKGKMISNKILDPLASQEENYYNNWKILITEGKNKGKEAKIIKYNGVERKIETLPEEFYTDNTSEYILYPLYHNKNDINTYDETTITKNEGNSYIIYPSEHLYGVLDGTSGTFGTSNYRIILGRNSLRINDYYVGWRIIVTTDGFTDVSLIKSYNSLTREIEAENLTKEVNSRSSYYLTKDKHVIGQMRTPIREVKEFELDGSGSSYEDYKVTLRNDDENKDKTGYYEGWDAYLIYTGTTGKEHHFQTEVSYHNYNGEIGLPGVFGITQTEFKITLVEKQKNTLSDDAFPIDDYYKGWTINATTDGVTQSSIITEYDGITKVIKAPGLTNVTTVSTIYTLVEPTEGTIIRNNDVNGNNTSSTNTLVLPSFLNNKEKYYKNWLIEINSSRVLILDYQINNTTKVKTVTLASSITAPSDGWANTKFKLLTPDANYNIGIGYQSDLYRTDGNNNISIGKFSGPLVTQGSEDDKLYIDSSNAPRGNYSFIYGDMFNCSLSLNSDVTISNNSANSTGTLTVTGITAITDNTSSTNTASGALIVTGGVGIGENLNVGGNTILTGTLQANNTVTVGVDETGHDVKFYGATAGAYMLWEESSDDLKLVNSGLIQSGNKSNTLTGPTTISNSETSTNTTSGALIVTGGVGIGENLNVGGNTVLTGTLQANNTITVGVDDTGYAVKFYGATAGAYMLWEESSDDLKLVNSGLIQSGNKSNTLTGPTTISNTVTVGENDTGYDVQFYGATNGAHMLWEQSSDDLKLVNSGLIQSGNKSNTLTGPTTISNTLTVGENDTGYDVKFYGATDGAHMLWEQSSDDLKLVNSGLIQSGNKSNTLTGSTTISNTVTVGANGIGHNVLFYGATSGAYMLWDKSSDSLELENSVLVQNGSNLTNTFDGIVELNNDTTSTDTSSGALIVTGGVGIGENLNVEGNTVLTGTLQANNNVTVGVDGTGHDVKFYGASSGAHMLWEESSDDLKLVNSGLIQSGTGLSNTLTGITTITDNTSSTDTTSGALIVTGGVGIGGNLNVEGNTILTGTLQANNTVTVGVDETGHDVKFYGATAGAYMLWEESSDDLKLVNSGLIQSGNKSNTLTGPTTISNTVTSTTTSSGALIVTGGVGIGGNLNVGGNLTVTGTTTTVNSNEVNIGDSMLLLNSGLDVNTAPSQNGGIEINRGNEDNTKFQWNETSDKWEAVVGSSYSSIRGKYLEAYDGTNSAGLRLYDTSTPNYVVTVSVPTLTSDYNFVLPNSGGSSGEILSTDGSGNLSWINNYGFTVVGGSAADKTENILFGKGIILDRYNHSTAKNNIIIGHESGNYPSDGTSPNFEGNTIIGNKSGRNGNYDAFDYNTVLGDKALGGDWESSNYLTSSIQAIGAKNTIIGAKAAALGDTLDENVIIGYESGYNLAKQGTCNVFVGNEAGKYVRGDTSNPSSNNICIGRASGPYTITSSHPNFITGGATNQPTPVSGRLFIDTGKRGGYRSGNSLLYGIQQPYGSSTSDSLSLNANVTINNLDGSSSGTLRVKGITYLENTTYLDSFLYVRDANNSDKITLNPDGSGTFNGAVYVNSTTNSSGSSSGALYVAGGVGIVKNLNVGGTTTITGNTTINGGTSINGTTNIDASLYIRDSTDANKFFVDHTNGNTTISGNLSITSGTDGTDVTDGALIVDGDVGIDGNIRLPNLVTDTSAMNFGGGYRGGGITIYKTTGVLSVRNSIRFYETSGSETDGYITLTAPQGWDQGTLGNGTLTLPLAIDTLVGKATQDVLTNKTIQAGTFTSTSSFENTVEIKNTVSTSFAGLIKFYHSDDTTNTILYGSHDDTNHSDGYIALPEGSSSSTSPYILATTTSSQTLTNKEISSPSITGLITLAGSTPAAGNVIAVNSAGNGLEWVTAYTSSGLIENDTSDYNMWGGHGQTNPPSSSAQNNILIGQVEGASSTTQRSSNFEGSRNTALGQLAFKLSATTCNDNSAFGYRALESITTGDENVAVGSYALNNLTTQSYNTSVGYAAGNSVGSTGATTGHSNTNIGYRAGYNIRGNNNIMLGFRAGHHINNNTNNHQNICIGSYSGPSSADAVNNRLYIDASGTVNDGLGENSLIYGDQSGSQGTGKQQYLRINGNLEIKKTTYDASTNPHQGTKPGQINLDGCLVFEESGANPQLKIRVKNSSGNFNDVFTFSSSGRISNDLVFDNAQERSIYVGNTESIKFYTTGLISDMKLGRVNNEGGGVGPTGDYNTLKWIGGTDTTGSIKWGSGSTGDGFNLSGGSSNSSDDTRNIHFGSGISSNIFDSMNQRNIIIGHYAGGDLTGANTSDDNIAIGYKSFKQVGSYSKISNIAIGSYTLGGSGSGTNTSPHYNIAIGPEALSMADQADGNVCVGYQSGKDLTWGNYNTLIGREVGPNLSAGIYRNVLLGNKAGINLNSNRNICIGDCAGLSSSSSESGYIIIETGMGAGADTDVTRGVNSFIYGEQGREHDDTLSINANVTINNLDSTSSGSLLVRGSTAFENSINFNSSTASYRRILIGGNDGNVGDVLTCGGSSGSISWSAPNSLNVGAGGTSTTFISSTTLYKENIIFGNDITLENYGIGATYSNHRAFSNIVLGHNSGYCRDTTSSSTGDLTSNNVILGIGSGRQAASQVTVNDGNTVVGNVALGSIGVAGNDPVEAGTGDFLNPTASGGVDTFMSYYGNGTDILGASSENTVIGYGAGSWGTTFDKTTLVGYMSGYYLGAVSKRNTFIGNKSGYYIRGGRSAEYSDTEGNNLCIGPGTGPSSISSGDTDFIYTSAVNSITVPSSQPRRSVGKIYIESGISAGSEVNFRGSNSIIYGDQSNSSGDTLSLNANVTINNLDSSSSGNLIVNGVFRNPGMGVNPTNINTFGAANFVLTDRGNEPRLYNWRPTANRVIIMDSTGSPSTATYSQVCFLPGTKVTLSNKKTIDIDDIKEGDKVLSYKFNDMEPLEESIDVLSWFSYDDSGSFSESVVSKIWKTTSMGGHVTLNNKLRVTHEHNIFVKIYQGEDNDEYDKKEDYEEEYYEEENYEEGDYEYSWIPAKEVKIGDYIFTDKGEYEEITEVSEDENPVNVYNMKVKSDSMNYFTDTYLVHNASPCDECSQTIKL